MRPRATNALTCQFTRLEKEIGERIESANLASDLIMVVMNKAATFGFARQFPRLCGYRGINKFPFAIRPDESVSAPFLNSAITLPPLLLLLI